MDSLLNMGKLLGCWRIHLYIFDEKKLFARAIAEIGSRSPTRPPTVRVSDAKKKKNPKAKPLKPGLGQQTHALSTYGVQHRVTGSLSPRRP